MPIRGAPDSTLIGPPVAIHVIVPTTLSTPQPAACRKVKTSHAWLGPAYATHATVAIAVATAAQTNARVLPATISAGATTTGQTFAMIAAANATPPLRCAPRTASAAPHAASATGTRSNRV